jgi:hypothetical protein
MAHGNVLWPMFSSAGAVIQPIVSFKKTGVTQLLGGHNARFCARVCACMHV